MKSQPVRAFLSIVFSAFMLLSTGCGSDGGSGTTKNPPPVPDFSIAISPQTLTLTSGTSNSFQVSVTPLNGFTGSVTIQVSNLPSGVTLNPAAPFSIAASSSQTITINVASTVAAASYTVNLSATSGSLSHSATVALAVQAPVNPGFSLSVTPSSITLPPGAQGTFQITLQPFGGFSGEAEVEISGLPAGVTMSPPGAFALGSSEPQTVTLATSINMSGGSYTLSVNASSGALSQSASEALTIGNSAPLPSRADFVRTDDTPGDIVYDQTHQCVYVTNPVAGTVDVISSQTYQILRRIPVPSPAGIDISPDNSTVFIGTGTQAVYALNTANMAITARYLVPNNQASASVVLAQPPEAPVAAPDGTVLISLSNEIVKWNPATNQTTTVLSNPPAGFQYGLAEGPMARSAGHTKLILSNNLSTSTVYVYDTATNTFSAPLTFNGYASTVAANPAGTQFAVAWVDNTSQEPWITFLDANLNTLAKVSGGGNILYSNDGSTLYESGIWNGQLPAIGTMSATTYTLTALKPLYASNEGNQAPPTTASTPMATDETGRIFGSADHGLAIDDITGAHTYAGTEVYPYDDLFAVPDAGPAGQQTSIEIKTSDTPVSAIWFGSLAGSYAGDSPYLSVTTAAVNQTGPVNIRIEDAGNAEVWMPQAYTFGAVLASGPDLAGPASGGVSVPLFGYGLGNNAAAAGTSMAAGTTITFGGVPATISSAYSDPPETPPTATYPFPLWDVTVTVPAVKAGAGDIVATTASGASTLHSAYHALNTQSYAMDGTPNSMIYDPTRQQLYIAVTDHVDVFSLASKSFSSAIQVPTLNGIKQLAGMALTPDGKDLIVSNWGDASVAVINPDSPSGATAVAIGAASAPSSGQGPNHLAATNTDLVFVGVGAQPDTISATGARRSGATGQLNILPSASSAATYSPEASVWLLNLSSMTASPYAPLSAAPLGPNSMAASPDGSQVCIAGEYIGFVLYASATTSLTTGPLYSGANACALSNSFVAAATSEGVVVGNLSLLETGTTSLLDYQLGTLNGSPFGIAVDGTGALLYVPYSNMIELFDAHTGEVRESIAPPTDISELLYDNGTIAVDSTGSQVFVFTVNGLTAIQMDELPLAIGSITASGSSWTIQGTGFSSGTAISVDGNPVSAQFNGTNELQVSGAPSLNSSHTIALTNPDGHSYTYDVAYLE